MESKALIAKLVAATEPPKDSGRSTAQAGHVVQLMVGSACSLIESLRLLERYEVDVQPETDVALLIRDFKDMAYGGIDWGDPRICQSGRLDSFSTRRNRISRRYLMCVRMHGSERDSIYLLNARKRL